MKPSLILKFCLVRAALIILALFAVATIAHAKAARGAACGSCSGDAIQMPPVIVQTAPTIVYSGGCQGGSANFAASANQGYGCAGSSGGSGRRLFSGGGILGHRSGAGRGLSARRNRGPSSGYETTTTVRQWDSRPAPATVVVPQALPAVQAPPARADGQP